MPVVQGMVACDMKHKLGMVACDMRHKLGMVACDMKHKLGMVACDMRHKLGMVACDMKHKLGIVACDLMHMLMFIVWLIHCTRETPSLVPKPNICSCGWITSLLRAKKGQVKCLTNIVLRAVCM